MGTTCWRKLLARLGISSTELLTRPRTSKSSDNLVALFYVVHRARLVQNACRPNQVKINQNNSFRFALLGKLKRHRAACFDKLLRKKTIPRFVMILDLTAGHLI